MISLLLGIKVGGAALSATGAGYGLAAKRRSFSTKKRLDKLLEEAAAGKFVSQFTRAELANTINGYIQPSCSPTDPTNSDDEAYLSDIREPVFNYMDRAVLDSSSRNYIILLADSGMGKTSFCISYRSHLLKAHPSQDVALISLTHPECDRHISRIKSKSTCILLLDALDEDAIAIQNGRGRLDSILELAVDFQSVVITCRSQFFADDHSIPVETPIRRISPRGIGQNQNATLKRFYLSPFDNKQVKRYINRHFPAWAVHRFGQRSRAFKLIADIPELASRPMLLERLPEIARGKDDLRELYQLYEFMVSGWAHRERNWIPEEKLLAVSREIAVQSFSKSGHRAQRITKSELQSIANQLINNDPDWNHLQTRSLLNRDSNGLFKFAHLSILEFLVVQSAVEGDERALSHPWTGFMKQLFISWGYYRHGEEDLAKARSLLTSSKARTSILPLSDYWAMPPRQGLPNFKMSATRRLNESGSSRLAIPQWRTSNISLDKSGDSITVNDHEFFLKWHTQSVVQAGSGGMMMTLTSAQQINARSDAYRFPSYDEFISLVEGLNAIGKSDLLNDGVFFPISDTPGEKRHLLVSLGKARETGGITKIVDKERLVSATRRTITCYETGQAQSHKYGSQTSVQVWWIDKH